ncbi:MAG: amino acid carrier protein [Rhodobacterales bacterium]|nr:amino acid carrier protein [Rhodobacterales bacterium]
MPTIDQQINDAITPFSEAFARFVFFEIPIAGVGVPVVVAFLVLGAVFFTLYFRGINVRGLPLAWRVLRGDFDSPDAEGEITHFQALTTALSGTVGIGNIGGVAVAITIGGPGATFWMIVAGFLGMATKFCECTLGVRYRRGNPDGSISGGPMFYLSRGLADQGLPNMGRALGSFYAFGIVIGCLGIGNMFQANQAYVQLRAVSGGAESPLEGSGWVVGMVLGLIVGAVILGGIRSIASVTSKLVPFMAGLYIIGAVVVIGLNIGAVPEAIMNILTGAFTAEGVTGGALGALIVGMKRAVFSNEAGIGSASIAHAAVRTNKPATEGLVALFGPFLDTLVICALSAMVIGVAAVTWPDFMQSGHEGVAMTSDAFGRTVWWFPYPLAVAAVLFAISTILSWAYYGLKGVAYLAGENKTLLSLYKLGYCMATVVGASVDLEPVLNISDAMVFVLCVPNVIGMIILAPVVKEELAKLQAVAAAPAR